jgi:DNA-binding response OmpR family regulator
VQALLPGNGNAPLAHGISPQGPVLRAFDLEIDTSTHTVQRASKPISLTPREYGLLELLAAHRGRVVKYLALQEHLRSGQSDPHPDLVDACVRDLRRKIDRGFAQPLLLTRWGLGHLLRTEEAPSAGASL